MAVFPDPFAFGIMGQEIAGPFGGFLGGAEDGEVLAWFEKSVEFLPVVYQLEGPGREDLERPVVDAGGALKRVVDVEGDLGGVVDFDGGFARRFAPVLFLKERV